MIDFSGYNEEDKKKTLLAMLIKMAKADLTTHSNENKFIWEVAKHFEVDIADVVLIMHGISDYDQMFPKNESERLKFFLHVLTMMRLDNKISDVEKETAREIALSLALHPGLSEDLISVLAQNPSKDIARTDLSGIVKKYMN